MFARCEVDVWMLSGCGLYARSQRRSQGPLFSSRDHMNIPERLFPKGLRAGNFRGEEDVKGSGNRDGNRV